MITIINLSIIISIIIITIITIRSVLLTVHIITDISTRSTTIAIGVEGSGFRTAASRTHMHLELPYLRGSACLVLTYMAVS